MRALRVLLALLIALPVVYGAPAGTPLAPRPVAAVGGDNCNLGLKRSNKYIVAETGETAGGLAFSFVSSSEVEDDCPPPPSTPQPYCSHGAWGSTFRAPRKDKPDGTPVLAAGDTILSPQWGARVNKMMFWRVYNSMFFPTFTRTSTTGANSNSILWISGLGELTAESMGMRNIPTARNRIGSWRLIVHLGGAQKKLWTYFTTAATAVRFGVLNVSKFSYGDGGGYSDGYTVVTSNSVDNHTWLLGGEGTETFGGKSASAALDEQSLDGLGRVYDNGLGKNEIINKIATKVGSAATGETALDALYSYLAPSTSHLFTVNPPGWNLVNNSTAVMTMARNSWFTGGSLDTKLPIEIWYKSPEDKLLADGNPGKDGLQDEIWVYDPANGAPLYSTGEKAWTAPKKAASEAAALAIKNTTDAKSVWNIKLAWPARLKAAQPFVDANIKTVSDHLTVLNTAMSNILAQQAKQRFVSSTATFSVITKDGGFDNSALKDPLKMTDHFGPEWRSKFYAPAFRRPYTATHGAFPGDASGLASAVSLCNSDTINIGTVGRQAVLIQPSGQNFPDGARGGVGNDYCAMNKVRGAGAAIDNEGSCFFAWVPYQIKPPKLEWQSWVTSVIRSYVPKKTSLFTSKEKPGVETPGVVGEPYIVDRATLQPMIEYNHINAQIDSVNFQNVAKLNYTQVGMTVEIGDPETLNAGFILPVRLEGPDGKGTWTSMVSRRLGLGSTDFTNYKISMVFPRTPAAQAQEAGCRDLSAADLMRICGVGFDPDSNQWYYHVRFRTWWEGAFQVVLGQLDGKDIRQIYSTFANADLPKSWTQAQRRAWFGAMRPWDCTNWARYADPSQQGVAWSSCSGQRTVPRMFQLAKQADIEYPGRSPWTADKPYYDAGERWVLYEKGIPVKGAQTNLVADDVDDWGDWSRILASPIGEAAYISASYTAPRPLFDPSIYECWDPVTDPDGSLAKAFGIKDLNANTWCWMNIPVLQAQGTP